jgi:hypothetical protein
MCDYLPAAMRLLSGFLAAALAAQSTALVMVVRIWELRRAVTVFRTL